MRPELLVFAALTLTTCNDPIPGLCKYDSECPVSSTGKASACYQGVCVALDLGAPCASASQCVSAFCADGVCCDSPCNDKPCQRCDEHSVAGAGHCGFAEQGSNLDSECDAPKYACSGKCKVIKTLSACAGSSYTCVSRDEVVNVPSGRVCSANTVVLVDEGEYCKAGDDCGDGKCQASRWWTSCDGTGSCREATDKTDAKIETVVAEAGKTLTAACGTSGATPCGNGAISCYSGQCSCPDGETLCSGSCVDTATDRANCGSCQHACSATQGCSEATCKRYVGPIDTVTDYKSGLVWQRANAGKPYSWTDAEAYCSKLSLGGFSSGWRLPSLDELRGIVDSSKKSPMIDLEVFPDTRSDFYWTSTPYSGSPGNMVLVSFKDGAWYYNEKAAPGWARCVR
jgi:hypothetical protein